MKISIYNTWDHVNKAFAEGEKRAVLAWDGEYRINDIIEFSELTPGRFYVVRVDATMDEALVYITKESVLYTVPFYEKKTSYNPLSFFGNRHYVSIRFAEDHEISCYRNLSRNSFDQHDVDGVYPHSSANVETRGEAVFAARNAIDGFVATRGHGEWPYESWGINRQDDAKITIDFGRKVDVDKIYIYTRADFPHDNWWVSGTLSFSDGSRLKIALEKKTDEPQIFENIDRKGITWLSLDELIKADDPSPFPALTQIEVYGTQSRLRADL
ncbi:MAG: carbohydrate-binding protein [Lachnospiraceae bacterium]|nr:carbohydrate-binding protein [Lachnospiraceae bacterium]